MFRIQICSMDAYEFLLLISYFLKELEYDNMLVHQFMRDMAMGLLTAKATKVVPDLVQLHSKLFGSIKERKNELANMATTAISMIGPL